MRQVLLIAGGVMLAIALIVGIFTLSQVNQEQLNLSSDLQYRTRILADSLKESIAPPLATHATTTVGNIIERIANNERVVGIGTYDNDGNPIALSSELPAAISQEDIITTVMDSDTPSGIFLDESTGQHMYVFASPIHDGNGRVVGALVIAQSANYINRAVWSIWRDNMLRLLVQLFIIGVAIFVLVRFVFFKALSTLTESIKAMRRGDAPGNAQSRHSFLAPLTNEISKISSSLRQARFAAGEEARLRLEKLDSPWTADRLAEFMKEYLKDRPIFVVSNREPYVHNKTKSGIEVSVPAGGLVTALEPVMDACGGMWIAHGSGTADHEVVDAHDKIAVPPEEPKYMLKRVWLTDEQLAGYYTGFANEALWPLCHMAHVRPLFRSEDWEKYQEVNKLFADTLLAEIKDVERPLVLVQDYHLALVPQLIKRSRPDAQVALFWHIPWPSAAQFSICPWRMEILKGMLGADLIGFHTQQYCNNFMDTVGSEIESRIDYEQFTISHTSHKSSIKPFPISIAFSGHAGDAPARDRTKLDELGIRSEFLGLGVDRLDYTKGILERLKGIEFLLRDYPEYRERFTFLQIAAPSRESVEKYREYAEEVTSEVARINTEYGTRTWTPIVLEKKNYSHRELQPLYREADVCLVTSLHDGMNLVAKEYTAACNDERGVLILSQFTGAARDLKGALLINPYSAENTAEMLVRALTMSPAEQKHRMKTMRASVRDYNVYRWSAELIKALAQLD